MGSEISEVSKVSEVSPIAEVVELSPSVVLAPGEITLNDWLAQQPPEFRAGVDRQYRQLLQHESDLRALRKLVGVTQTELARQLGCPDQGSLSKFERKTDISLRKLREFVRCLGGELDIVVRLPNQPPTRLDKLSDATDG